MAPRRTYEGGLVQGVAIPNIGFEQYEAQRRASADLNERLQQIKNFALKAGSYEAQLRAADYVAGNAPDLSVYEQSTIEQRKKLEEDGYFKGKVTDKTFTLYDKAVREHQINYIKSKFESMAVTSFEDIVGAAELGMEMNDIIDPFVLRSMIESQVNGLSDAIVDIDGAAGLDVRADLAKLGDSYYQSYLDKYIKKQAEILDAETVAQTESTYNAIPRFFSYGSQVPGGVDEYGNMMPIATVNYLLGEYKDKERNKLLAAGITAPNLKDWEGSWDTAVLDGAVSYAAGLAKDSSKVTSREALQGIALSAYSENFSGNENLIGIYNQLKQYPDRQQAIKDEIIAWAKTGIENLEKEEELANKTELLNFSAMRTEFRKHMFKKEYDKAQSILLNMIEGVNSEGTYMFDAKNPELDASLKDLLNNFENKETSGGFLDQSVISTGFKNLAAGTLDMTWLDENMQKIGNDKYNELVLKLQAQQKDMLQKGLNYLKVQFAVSDLNMAGTGEDASEYFIEYQQAYSDLLTWYLDNETDPGTTADSVFQKAVELVGSVNLNSAVDGMTEKFANSINKAVANDSNFYNIVLAIEADETFNSRTMDFGENIIANPKLRTMLVEHISFLQGKKTDVPESLLNVLDILGETTLKIGRGPN